MKRLAMFLLLFLPGWAVAQQSGPLPGPPVKPYPFAASRDYPDIPGLCIVPAWEYPFVDDDQDGIAEPDELIRYCRKIDRHRPELGRF